MNIMERFGILNASDIRLFNKTTDKLMLKIIQANEISLEVKADSKSALEQGIKAITWNLAKTGTLKIKTETTSFAQLAETLGSTAGLKLNTSTESYDRSEKFTVTTAGTLSLSLAHNPLASSIISFNLLTRDGELAKELVAVKGATAKDYTITDSDLTLNSVVEVNYIESIVAGGVYTFKVAGQNDGVARRLVSNVLCKNRVDGSLIVAQLHIPNVVVEQNITFTFSATDVSKFEISMEVQADGTRTDEEGNPLFFELRALADPKSIPTITDLALTALDDSISTTFSHATGGTNVKLQYKKSTDLVYTDAPNVLNGASTGATITGLTDATAYNVRLSFDVSGTTYFSNVATVTTL